MDVIQALDDLASIVEDAKAMPLSSSCLINRAEVLELIDEIRDALPEALSRADSVLRDRSAVLESGRAEAEALIEEAREEQKRLVSAHEVYLVALADADALRVEAAADIERQRREADDYIDARLASFEVLLQKTLTVVERGRERLRQDAEDDYDDLGPLPG
jgi:hypothetical protein